MTYLLKNSKALTSVFSTSYLSSATVMVRRSCLIQSALPECYSDCYSSGMTTVSYRRQFSSFALVSSCIRSEQAGG